jgi:hypothetical protein
MTDNNTNPRPAICIRGTDNDINIADFDLTPRGLDDAPAHQQDTESIVYTGNS